MFRRTKPYSPSERLEELDALRGIAAVGVAFIFHQTALLGLDYSRNFQTIPILGWVENHGWTLVDLFFVLSGFVFAHVYAEKDALRDGITAKGYFVARFARLYPLHLATLISIAVVFLFVRPPVIADAKHFLLNLLMLQESGLNNGMSFNVPSWSLSVEVFCYFLFFLFARTKKLSLIAIIVVPAFALVTTGNNDIANHIARGPVGFFAGFLIYRHGWIAAVLLAVAGAILAFLQPSLGVLLALCVWPTIILLAPQLHFLRWNFMQWLGDRSLSIYLIHYPVFVAIRPLELSETAKIWVALPAVLLLSDLSFRFYEVRMRRWIRLRWS